MNSSAHRISTSTASILASYPGLQFSSVHFDLITQEMLHLQYTGGFHAGAWAPLVGDGDDIITELT